MNYIDHPFINKNKIEARAFQIKIAENAALKNTLVILPTGMGKTVIATLVIAQFLKEKGPKILFLAPTRPLVKQHEATLIDFIKGFKIASVTGLIKISERSKIWSENDIIVATPQVVESALKAQILDPAQFKLAIFDEAHRSIGNYAYTFLSNIFSKYSHIIGFTASPSSKAEKIEEIMRNLQIENLEIRNESDEDIIDYTHMISIDWYKLDMPADMVPLHDQLKQLYNDVIFTLSSNSIFSKYSKITKRILIEAQKKASIYIKEGRKEYFSIVSTIAMAIKIDQAIEYLETQGFEACKEYLEKIVNAGNSETGSKADKKLVKTAGFVNVVLNARKLAEKKIEDPKLGTIIKLIRQQIVLKPDSKIIVFTNFRNVNNNIYETLKEIENVKPLRFVGQANKESNAGLSQKEQAAILEKFRTGEFNVLVSTQVGEEGLDIPQTDLVIFNEPIPSEIRNIQRRGRTGRKRAGKVIILMYKNTRDEIYFWSSKSKERKMKSHIERLKNKEPVKRRGQTTIFEF
jgi:Fanconi anemia group M protein